MSNGQMAPRTREALRRLRTMAGQTGQLYRNRIAEAVAALRDQAWIAGEFDSKYSAAVNHLQEQWFADICGFITLDKLMKLYEVLPASTWRSYHYNLRALELLHDRPDYANGDLPHVSVRAYVRFPPGIKKESKKTERERLLTELRRLDRRRARIVRRLRELGEAVR